MVGAASAYTRRRMNQASRKIRDPGAGGSISVGDAPFGAVCEIVTAAAEARALPDPIRSGSFIVLAMKTDGGDCTITAASAIAQSGETIITMGDANDNISLVSIPDGSGFRWSYQRNDGCSLS